MSEYESEKHKPSESGTSNKAAPLPKRIGERDKPIIGNGPLPKRSAHSLTDGLDLAQGWLPPDLRRRDVTGYIVNAVPEGSEGRRQAGARGCRLGDGYDMAVSPVSPDVIVRRARADDDAMFAILWRPPRMARMYEREPYDSLSDIIPNEILVEAPDKIEEVLRIVIDRLPVRYELVFDAGSLDHHRSQELELRDGEVGLGSVTVDLRAAHEPARSIFWRVWIIAATVLLVAGVISARRMRARR